MAGKEGRRKVLGLRKASTVSPETVQRGKERVPSPIFLFLTLLAFSGIKDMVHLTRNPQVPGPDRNK